MEAIINRENVMKSGASRISKKIQPRLEHESPQNVGSGHIVPGHDRYLFLDLLAIKFQ